MISSILIKLRPVSAGQLNSYAGYLAHAAFFDLLRQVDPIFSQTLHDIKGRKPFTLSSLTDNPLPTNQSMLVVNPLKTYQLRLTSLAPAIFETFMQGFWKLDTTNLKIRLGNLLFQVLKVEGTSGDWVGRSSFEELSALPAARTWSLCFSSPTVFSLGEQDWGGRKFLLFPTPEFVFDNLANAWSEFAPTELATIDKPLLRQYVDKYVMVSGHNIQTALLYFKQHNQLGFTGQVTYRVMEKQPSVEMTSLLNRLAAFALYAGIGYKTSMGMGQSRCTSLAKEANPYET